MKPAALITTAVLYVLMLIFTFGHAWQGQPPRRPEPHTAEDTLVSAVNSLISAAAWPFYWSAQLQKPNHH